VRWSALRTSAARRLSTFGDRYVTTAPIATSQWRVAITEPGSTLYPTLVGSRDWVLWVVFGAVALAGVLAVFLLARVLSGTARVSMQASEIQSANDALAKANAELDAFSYSVSHDLRGPLRAIDGFSRIVIEEGTEQLSDEQQRYLGLVRSNTQKMGELIDDLLALSRVGSRPLERHTVDTNNLVAEVRASFADEIADREVEMTVGDLPQVRADRALLRQVFHNLIGNALKYSRDRSPARISVTPEHDGGETVFNVRDNGVGFDMRYADKLFEVFQRLHRAEDYEGTGVGLAIVARIISRHGGRVWADSSPGEGAVFHFTLGADAT
ncbi:MAG: sensor histidine kinase, partial [Gaiellaceae bacterium]